MWSLLRGGRVTLWVDDMTAAVDMAKVVLVGLLPKCWYKRGPGTTWYCRYPLRQSDGMIKEESKEVGRVGRHSAGSKDAMSR